LKPVGSFKGAGPEELVFDLGGNAAEWAVYDRDGAVVGGSADMPSDTRIAVRKPKPEYIGFRLIRERTGR